jgi:predicted HTH domain antitoxin
MDENVTVMSPEELDIKDDDMEKMRTEEVTLDVNVQLYFKHCESCLVTISFSLADVPVSTSEAELKGSIVNALHDAFVNEDFIKCKAGSRIMLFAPEDVSRLIIEDIKIRKGE